MILVRSTRGIRSYTAHPADVAQLVERELPKLKGVSLRDIPPARSPHFTVCPAGRTATRRDIPGHSRRPARSLTVRSLVLAMVLLLAGTATATARTIVWPDPSPHAHAYQRWINKSRMPTPDRVVRVGSDMSECGEWAHAWGCAFMAGPWQVVIRPIRSAWRERMSLYHELGHLFDRHYLTAENRRWLRARLGMSAYHWDQVIPPRPHSALAPERLVPQEAVAELYAECSYYSRRFIRTFGPDPTDYGVWLPRLKLSVCGYMRRAYRRGPA